MTNDEILSNIADAHNKVKDNFLKENKRKVSYTEYAKAINDTLGYELYSVNNLPLVNIYGDMVTENTMVSLDENVTVTTK